MFPRNRLLIAEDEEDYRLILKRFLDKTGLSVTYCTNGLEALKVYRENPFPVVITDLNMPGMDGIEFIKQLELTETDPVVMVFTSHTDQDQIFELMKLPVSIQYILKPTRMENLKRLLMPRVKQAFDIAEQKSLKNALQRENELRLQKLLSWNLSKMRIARSGEEKSEKKYFMGLSRSLHQSAGLGSLITGTLLMPEVAEKQADGSYLIPADYAEILLQNAEIGNKAMGKFKEMGAGSAAELKLKRKNVSSIRELLEELKSELERFLPVKNLSIEISREPGGEMYVFLNIEELKKAFYEIMINALKFSQKDTNVVILFKIFMGYYVISFLNIPEDKGITRGYEELIFEPFIRLDENDYPEFETTSYGLGLAVAKRIIEQHKGRIYAGNIMDHASQSAESIKDRVNIEVHIPLEETEIEVSGQPF